MLGLYKLLRIVEFILIKHPLYIDALILPKLLV
jgi:hypothetical protein